MLQLRVVGAKTLAAKMRGLADDLRSDVLVTAATVGALPVEADAKRRVPRATGQLAASIRREVVHADGDVAVVAVKAGGRGAHGGRPVAQFVEFGTSRTPAQPFLRPALREQRAPVLRAVRATVASLIRRRFGL
jgi:HK97 gp10 family phage protein